MAPNLPFEINPELTGIALAYRNNNYVADKVLPRVKVSKRLFEYNEYDKGSFLTVPKTEIGRKGEAETMELKSRLVPASCIDYSLKAEVPQVDVEEAQANNGVENPIQDNTLLTVDGLKLAREKRVANLITTASNYGGNVTILSAAQENTFAYDESSFNAVFEDVINKMAVAPNYAVVSQTGALKLQRHPDFLALYKNYNSDNRGRVPLDFIAKELGLKEIIVGSARLNTAKLGKTPVIENIWGDDMAFIYINPLAKPKAGLTFGMTAEASALTVQTYFDSDKGAKGLNIIRPVETLKEFIACSGCGYLIKNAFAKA